jgi:hypothetical protein
VLKYTSLGGKKMKNLTREVQQKLFNVEKKRIELSRMMELGMITDEDILNLIKLDVNYGLRINRTEDNPKKLMLKNIFNCPFLLCDQKNLSNNIKMVLPYLLNARYNVEKNNLKIYLEQNLIDDVEYENTMDELNFFYYESTHDGKSILENNYVFFEKKQAKSL